MKTMTNRAIRTILLVEDSPADQRAIGKALRRSPHDTFLAIAEDGVCAMDYLYQRGHFASPKSAPRPDLILLDLNMPRLDGRQLIAHVKQDAKLRSIPIVVLTTSSLEQDISQCYALGVNSYVTKPVDMEDYVGTILSIEKYWLDVVVLPPESHG